MECTDWKAFTLLSAAVFVIFADQNLMAPNLTQIARDFGMNDEERDRKLGGRGGAYVNPAPSSAAEERLDGARGETSLAGRRILACPFAKDETVNLPFMPVP